MKKIVILMLIFILLPLNLFSDEREVIQKANKYLRQKNYEAALAVLDDGMKEFGETSQLLLRRYDILLGLKRYDEALKTALKNENVIQKEPSAVAAWNCIFIAQTYVHLKNYDEALDWLEKAVDRGFTAYKALGSVFKTFKVLENNDRYKSIINKIKANIAIGKMAKDFTVELVSGEKFTLSEQKGKVVLIDFWATWCLPCKADNPFLKKYYEEFKNKGFEIIGISLDENKDVLDKYIKESEISWKVAFSGKGMEDDTCKMYGVNVLPSYSLVDKNGILRNFNISRNKLREAIARLVTEEQ